jgi:hypothetical protein
MSKGLIRQSSFSVVAGQGWTMAFPNGLTISVMFRDGNYCDNQHNVPPAEVPALLTCANAEVAVWETAEHLRDRRWQPRKSLFGWRLWVALKASPMSWAASAGGCLAVATSTLITNKSVVPCGGHIKPDDMLNSRTYLLLWKEGRLCTSSLSIILFYLLLASNISQIFATILYCCVRCFQILRVRLE